MVHVSSAYANSFHLETQEILYDVLGDAEHIIELVKTLDEKQLEELEPKYEFTRLFRYSRLPKNISTSFYIFLDYWKNIQTHTRLQNTSLSMKWTNVLIDCPVELYDLAWVCCDHSPKITQINWSMYKFQ